MTSSTLFSCGLLCVSHDMDKHEIKGYAGEWAEEQAASDKIISQGRNQVIQA